MLFADGGDAGVPTWALGVVAVATVLLREGVAAARNAWKAKSDAAAIKAATDAKSDATAMKSWQGYCKKLEENGARQEARIDRLQRSSAQCREREVALKGHINLMCEVMRNHGLPMGDIPSTPHFPSEEESEFEDRSSAQEAQSIKDVSKRLKKESPP